MQNVLNALMRLFYRLAYKVITGVWFITRPTIRGVFVAVWYQTRILIVKNAYRKWYIVPCGGIKRNETMVQAAVRELFEEAGIRAKPSQLRFAGNFSERYKYALDNGHFYELILTTRPEVKIDHREVVWAGFMETDDALGLNLNPLVRTYLQKKIDDAAD